jgi:hypothetical protein
MKKVEIIFWIIWCIFATFIGIAGIITSSQKDVIPLIMLVVCYSTGFSSATILLTVKLLKHELDKK